jgi:hypothetical protein
LYINNLIVKIIILLMVKEMINGSSEIEADLFDIFTDNGTGQLEQQLLKSKRKLLNAKVSQNII